MTFSKKCAILYTMDLKSSNLSQIAVFCENPPPVHTGTGGFFCFLAPILYDILNHINYNIYFIGLSRYNIVKEMISWQKNCKSQRSLT